MSVQRRRGQKALVFRQVMTQDSRGNLVKQVDMATPIEVRAAFIPGRSSRAEVAGQVAIDVVTMIVKANLPDVGAWSRVRWRDTDWDVMAPPEYHHGTRHSRHWSLDLRARPGG